MPSVDSQVTVRSPNHLLNFNGTARVPERERGARLAVGLMDLTVKGRGGVFRAVGLNSGAEVHDAVAGRMVQGWGPDACLNVFPAAACGRSAEPDPSDGPLDDPS
jgi:hypothetical protein